MWQPNLRDSSWQTLIPRRLFPLASKRGEKTPIASLPGTTATIPPLTLLLAGNPTVYAAVSQRVNRVRCDEPRCGPNRQPSRNSVAATARPGLRPEQLSPHNCKAGGLIGSSSFGCPSESTLIVRKLRSSITGRRNCLRRDKARLLREPECVSRSSNAERASDKSRPWGPALSFTKGLPSAQPPLWPPPSGALAGRPPKKRLKSARSP
jgi:hypothetical protein